jgi:hypothetical protein
MPQPSVNAVLSENEGLRFPTKLGDYLATVDAAPRALARLTAVAYARRHERSTASGRNTDGAASSGLRVST